MGKGVVGPVLSPVKGLRGGLVLSNRGGEPPFYRLYIFNLDFFLENIYKSRNFKVGLV